MINTPNSTIRPQTPNLPAIRRQADRQSTADSLDRDSLHPPRGRGFSSIPNEETLQMLIDRALSAMKQGITWDRGSILNIQA